MTARHFKLCAAGVLLLWAGLALAAPKAVPVNPRYEFPPTPEGQTVIHEFIIRNGGDEDLTIRKVIPSCSCVSHSFDKTIAPGEEGGIRIGVSTGGYGGNQLSRRILVKTDDPDRKEITLTVTGRVTRTVTVKPAVVSIYGNPGQRLEALVTITPALAIDMRVLGMTQKFNTKIKAELVAPGPGSRDWHVKIKTYSDKAGDFYEILTLKTDNPAKPELKVRVYAIYFDKIKAGNS